MNGRRLPSQPDELLRRWGTQAVPVDDEERVNRRREVVVDALSRSIRQSAERSDRLHRVRSLSVLGVAAALALSVGVFLHARKRPALASGPAVVVEQVSGAVVVTEAGESRVLRAGANASLRSVAEVETAADARAELHTDKSVVRVGAATKLSFAPSNAVEERYRLALGHVDVSVDKQARAVRSVVVETPNAEVVVHGTVFAVGVTPGAEHTVTDVSVTRGSVWVLANGVQVAVLGPGQHWSSEYCVIGKRARVSASVHSLKRIVCSKKRSMPEIVAMKRKRSSSSRNSWGTFHIRRWWKKHRSNVFER
jgi:hypothetical protein